MKLKSLRININGSYDDNPGRYTCKVEFENERSEGLTLVLPSEVSDSLLVFLGPTLTAFTVQQARELENNLKHSIETSRGPNLIEAKSETLREDTI